MPAAVPLAALAGGPGLSALGMFATAFNSLTLLAGALAQVAIVAAIILNALPALGRGGGKPRFVLA